METFEAIPKHWGNSLGITIPKEIVKRNNLSESGEVTVFVISKQSKKELRKAFGTFKCEMPTQEIMDKIDEGYD